MSDDAHELRFETPFGHLAATWTPAGGDDQRPVLVCLHGGTYTRRYFDLDVPEDPTYSFVDHARNAGWATLCLDALGTGESARPVDPEVVLDTQADALAHALGELPNLSGRVLAPVVVGHSMGGYLAMRMQARHRLGAALAILGTTNHAVAPLALPAEMVEVASTPEGRRSLVDAVAGSMPAAYLEPDRTDMMSWFHLDDVPDAVRRADASAAGVVPRRVAAESTVPGICAADAAVVVVPVLLVYGEVDVSPEPRTEPSFFSSCDDVTLHVLRASAHCHNMAGTRRLLWNRLLHWAAGVDACAPLAVGQARSSRLRVREISLSR